MAEKLKPSEIDKLRALIGMGAEPQQPAEVPEDESHAAEVELARGPQQQQPPQRRAEVPPECPPEPASIETELFVKVDEHAIIGEILASSKGNMKSIADTVSLLAKAEKLKSDAIERMESILNDIDSQIADIESKLAAPEGLSVPELGGISAVSDDLIDLRSELESLKGELGKINK